MAYDAAVPLLQVDRPHRFVLFILGHRIRQRFPHKFISLSAFARPGALKATAVRIRTCPFFRKPDRRDISGVPPRTAGVLC
jgi:hypothetical protein